MTGRIRKTLTIPCKVIWDNTNKLTVQWKKNGVDEIDMTGRFSKGASDNSLVIKDLEFGDQGRCCFSFPLRPSIVIVLLPFHTFSQNECSATRSPRVAV